MEIPSGRDLLHRGFRVSHSQISLRIRTLLSLSDDLIASLITSVGFAHRRSRKSLREASILSLSLSLCQIFVVCPVDIVELERGRESERVQGKGLDFQRQDGC